MLSEGNLVLDISGEEKANLTIEDLLQKFENSGTTVSDKDRFIKGKDVKRIFSNIKPAFPRGKQAFVV